MKSEVVFAGFGITPKIMEDIVKLYFVADIPLFGRAHVIASR